MMTVFAAGFKIAILTGSPASPDAATLPGLPGAGASMGTGAGAGAAGGAGDFAWAFDCAREAGLGLTCRAAEESGPQAVRDALALGIRRIGPGIRAADDGALVRA